MAELRVSRRPGSGRRVSPWGVTLIVLGVVLWAVQKNLTLTLLAALLLAPPTVLVLVVVWRRLLPHSATKALRDLGATSREGEGPRLRRLWRRRPVWHLAWKMPTGVTVSALTKRREAVEQALDASCEFWYERGLFHMRAGVHAVPRLVTFEDIYRRQAPTGELVIGVGMSREGPLWVDLTKVLHVLNGGQTDRGKSSWTRQVLTWLALRYGPEHVRFALIDLKGG